MSKTYDVNLTPEEAFDESRFKKAVFQKLSINQSSDLVIRPLRRSIDARGKQTWVKFQLELLKPNQVTPLITHNKDYPNISDKPAVIIVGAGPAGLFAAIRLIELGMKPIIFERGKDVKTRSFNNNPTCCSI